MASKPTINKAPLLIYGTAFKFDNTTELVSAALNAGFRAFDTAGSTKAYREDLVGNAIGAAISKGEIKREDVYIQTKFSPYKAGRDKTSYPYDVSSEIEAQVEQSIESSFRNLQTTHIDSLILHSLYPNIEDTLRAWKAMEALVPSKVSVLGVSDTDASTLRTLYDAAKVKPSVVQNRLTGNTAANRDASLPADLPYPAVPYDRDVRAFCAEKGIGYNPWGVLWGNERLMAEVRSYEKLTEEVGVTSEVACLFCVQSAGPCAASILCGSTKAARMQQVVEGLAKIKGFCESSQDWRERWLALKESIARILNAEDAS